MSFHVVNPHHHISYSCCYTSVSPLVTEKVIQVWKRLSWATANIFS